MDPKWGPEGSPRASSWPPKWGPEKDLKLDTPLGGAKGAILVTVSSFLQGEASQKRLMFGTILEGLWDAKWA